MDMYKLKWTRLQSEIFRFFCIKAGRSFNLREVSKFLKKSPTAVSNAIQDLKRDNLINVKKIDGANLLSIEFNRDNEKAIELKRIENLKLIYESGLVNCLEEKFPGVTVVLFGSYSRGDDVCIKDLEENKSDIDIAMIGEKEKDIDLKEFNKKLEREVVLNFYGSFEKIHKHLRNSILNGVVLLGGVDI